jgi:hypothetical protein
MECHVWPSTIAVINLDLSFCCRLLLNPKYFSGFGFRVSQWLRRGHGRGVINLAGSRETRPEPPRGAPHHEAHGQIYANISVLCSHAHAPCRMPHAACSCSCSCMMQCDASYGACAHAEMMRLAIPIPHAPAPRLNSDSDMRSVQSHRGAPAPAPRSLS